MGYKGKCGLFITLIFVIGLIAFNSTNVNASNGIIEIKDEGDLEDISIDLNGKYILKENINLDGVDWTPIGSDSKPFTGTFDGNGKEISNLTNIKLGINNNIGLFGAVEDASISNLKIKNFNISGKKSTGTVAGVIEDSEITKVSGTNISISGSADNVGGLFGKADNTKIEKSFVEGTDTVRGKIAGGLVGDFSGNTENGTVIKNSYVVSKVHGTARTGGLVGKLANGGSPEDDPIIINSYFVGEIPLTNSGYLAAVGTNSELLAENSYYTTDFLSQHPPASLGKGKTIPEMQEEDTYKDNG